MAKKSDNNSDEKDILEIDLHDNNVPEDHPHESTANKSTANEISDQREPEWMNPANDRKTPYTEEQLEEFAEGFLSSMADTPKLQIMLEQHGRDKVKAILIERFRQQDERNLINMKVEGAVH